MDHKHSKLTIYLCVKKSNRCAPAGSHFKIYQIPFHHSSLISLSQKKTTQFDAKALICSVIGSAEFEAMYSSKSYIMLDVGKGIIGWTKMTQKLSFVGQAVVEVGGADM